MDQVRQDREQEQVVVWEPVTVQQVPDRGNVAVAWAVWALAQGERVCVRVVAKRLCIKEAFRAHKSNAQNAER